MGKKAVRMPAYSERWDSCRHLPTLIDIAHRPQGRRLIQALALHLHHRGDRVQLDICRQTPSMCICRYHSTDGLAPSLNLRVSQYCLRQITSNKFLTHAFIALAELLRFLQARWAMLDLRLRRRTSPSSTPTREGSSISRGL